MISQNKEMENNNYHFKLNEILDIPENNPFQNDALRRKIIADRLTTILRNISQPFVISLSSPWGTGKTTFIKMWSSQLKTDGFTCLYFNAWENDFADEPAIAFIGEMENCFSELTKTDTKSKQYLKKMKSLGGKVFKTLTPLAIQWASRGAIKNIDELKDIIPNEDEFSKFLSKLAEDKIKEYRDKKKTITEFKESLYNFTREIQKKNSTPLIFFIDELDRCRPTYAVELLESIKHLFSVNGIIFILSIDKSQIVETIKSLYGQNMEADGYLRRFFDLDYQLPIPSNEDFYEFLYNKFQISKYFTDPNMMAPEDLKRTFIMLSQVFRLSLREQSHCFTRIFIAVLSEPASSLDFVSLTFIVILKMKESKLYSEFINQNASCHDIIDLLDKKYRWELVLTGTSNKKLAAYLKVILLRAFLEPTQFDLLLKDMQSIPPMGQETQWELILKDIIIPLATEHGEENRFRMHDLFAIYNQKIDFLEKFKEF